MSDERRPYRKVRRAAGEAATRLRITESAMALHGSVGPARTTISAIAEHAGVRRSTVYRHFGDEAALFAACSAHWAAANPLPDPQAWVAHGDDRERLRAGLGELYAFFDGNDRMLANLYRDLEVVEALRGPLGAFDGYLAAAADVLAGPDAPPLARAAAGHAAAFGTWRSLVRGQGLDDADADALMASLVVTAAA